MRDLTPSRVAMFRNDRLKQVSPATVIKELTILRHVVALGVQEWGLDRSLAMVCKVRNPAPPRGRNRRLEEGQLSDLLCQLRALKNPRIIDIVEFAIETAMRRGELLALCWHDVNAANRFVSIKLSKNGEGRVVPLTPKALVILERVRSREAARDERSAVFPLAPAALRMAWVRAIGRLQISDFKFHDLRHEAISRFFELGLTIPEVALISGHRDVRMLFRYTHLKPSNVTKKLWQLDQSGFGVRDLSSKDG